MKPPEDEALLRDMLDHGEAQVARSKVRLHTRRSADGDPIADAEILQRTINGLRGTGVAPRGVYRFRSHEEAERWQIHQMALLHARHSSKTSSGSAGG